MKIIKPSYDFCTWDTLSLAAGKGHLGDYLDEGDLIPIRLSDGEPVELRVSFDENGKCFFVTENCLYVPHRMSPIASTAGGWECCEMRQYLNAEIFNQFPEDLKRVIVPTKIVQQDIDGGIWRETKDKLFLFSMGQVFGFESNEQPIDPRTGEAQISCFKKRMGRIKFDGDDCAAIWWLRSANYTSVFHCVDSSGSVNGGYANFTCGVALGFCIS